MNSDTLSEQLQKGVHVTLGAATFFLEVIQDPQKRDESLPRLGQEWSQLAEEWAEKGKETEQNARAFVDNLFSQTNSPTSPSSTSRPSTTTGPTAPPDVQLELQELTAQIAAIRMELEKLRNQNAS